MPSPLTGRLLANSAKPKAPTTSAPNATGGTSQRSPMSATNSPKAAVWFSGLAPSAVSTEATCTKLTPSASRKLT